MPAKIIDGKYHSKQILSETKEAVARLVNTGGRPPCLAVVLVGDDPASAIYVGSKKKTCEEVGIKSREHIMPGNTSPEALFALIDELNKDDGVDGILVQSPLPSHMDEGAVFRAIDPAKDVDGFHPVNAGLLTMGEGRLVPCTPAGVIELLRREGVKIQGAKSVVIGRSNIVGKPAAMLMLKENATVTICHSRTSSEDLIKICGDADIIIAAVGRKFFLEPHMVKEGAVIIDVGINRTPGTKKIFGDVDPACMDKAAAMTPVPGGVGPMTVAMLMKNCLDAYQARKELNPK